jgi:cell division septation protein DedD
VQGKDAPKPSPSPAAATPVATPADSQSPTPSPKSSPSPTPAKPAAAKPDPAPTVGNPYWVFVDSFASRTNANTRLAELKKKGFNTATVYAVTGSKVPYKVRLGPFPDLDAANAMKARLIKEGYKPSVTR